jgi:hypothetical protein
VLTRPDTLSLRDSRVGFADTCDLAGAIGGEMIAAP